MKSTSVRRVLILGANGRFGAVATAAFAQAGWEVLAQHRPGRSYVPPSGVQSVACDATDAAALITAAQGASVIVNALNPDYGRWATLVPPIARAVEAAARVSGALLMLPGNVYNYGSQLPERVDESTPWQADTPNGKVRVMLEEGMRAAAAQSVRSVVLRAGDYFGGDRSGTWIDLVMKGKLAGGTLVYPGSPDKVHSWAYLPDLARAFVALAEQAADFKGYNSFGFAGHALTGDQFHQACERVLGRPLAFKKMGWGPVRVLGLFSPAMAQVLRLRYLWERSHRIDGRALLARVGALPQTPIEVALRASLAPAAANSTSTQAVSA
ncbi:NAD-dependent epimerase/dehydratase family protein [Niveibacterium sp. SC-1]|uniref:NAD-dependent epimerase/dehydratase family protein n=1 Tax=Niveibacterium sp. SC-1 TaxID=3135646 RepID=UPI00311DC258